MIYNIISTGSKGNAVIINNCILIDCGVPFKSLEPYIRDLKIVLLTHIHSDHFCPSTIRKLAAERPTLRFGCCKWLINNLVAAGVPKWRIDVYSFNSKCVYKGFELTAVSLNHNVPNCGYKITMNGEKLLYATDTNDLNGISAKNFDLYMLEANYDDVEIQERIKEKEADGRYAYEKQVLHNHLSKAKCDDFIINNAGIKSQFVYLHGHIGANI